MPTQISKKRARIFAPQFALRIRADKIFDRRRTPSAPRRNDQPRFIAARVVLLLSCWGRVPIFGIGRRVRFRKPFPTVFEAGSPGFLEGAASPVASTSASWHNAYRALVNPRR